MVQDQDTLRGLIAQARPRSTDVKLTLANLTSLKTADGDTLEIIETIAPDWKTVGYLIDFDPNGRKVDVIEANYAHKRNSACNHLLPRNIQTLVTQQGCHLDKTE